MLEGILVFSQNQDISAFLPNSAAMPIVARRLIRKMRGGAQSHLIEGNDGAFYVVKFTNNPQHRRILVNEWLSGVLLRYLQVYTPEMALIELTPEFIRRESRLADRLRLAARAAASRYSLWLADGCRSRPRRHLRLLARYLLGKIENRVDFLGTLIFDKWVGNADSRQAIFFRAKARNWTPLKGEAPARVGFFAQMIDHGFAFNGPHWTYMDSPIQGIYFRTSVYANVTSFDSFQPWLDMVRHLPEGVLDEAWKQIPRAWMEGTKRTWKLFSSSSGNGEIGSKLSLTRFAGTVLPSSRNGPERAPVASLAIAV